MGLTVSNHIEATPDTCGGKPRIAGTRIRVQDVVAMTEAGESADDIVSAFPHITLADVHAALAYYYDHRDEIDRHMREADEWVAAIMVDPAWRNPQKPAGKDADADSLSS